MDFLLFVAVLSLLIFVHEAGHFFSAKKAGIKVLEFGFGLPPMIIGKQIGETIYSINWLPFGGFVRLFGEEAAELSESKLSGEEKEKLKKVAFFTQPKLARVIVLLSGIMMNALLGVILFSGLYTVVGIPELVDKVQVIGIVPGSPAESALELGDEVIAIEGHSVFSTEDFKQIIDSNAGKETTFYVKRDELTLEAKAVPRTEHPDEEGALGVVISPKVEFVHYPFWQMPFRGAWYGMGEAFSWGVNIVSGIGLVFKDIFTGSVPKDVGGPFEIYFLVSEVASAGIIPLVQLVGILSVNLAIVNLLPIPGLDGGRLLFIGFEAVTGKRVSEKMERLTQTMGMAFLLALMLAITVQDILRRFPLVDSVSTLFKNMVNM